MSAYVFVNISDNHFKVWGHDGFCSDKTGEHEIITYWGRIGLPMYRLQKHKKYIDNFHDARKYIFAKIAEKICKGYKGIPNGMYFQMIQSPRGIAALIEKVKHLEETHETYYQNKRKTG